jgi:hypothetical protein
LGAKQNPPEIFAVSTLYSWIRKDSKNLLDKVRDQRGNPHSRFKVSPKRLQWAEGEISQRQQQGQTPTAHEVREILNDAFRLSLKDSKMVYGGRVLGARAMLSARKALVSLGVQKRKVNVKTKARQFQEYQLRNYICYSAIFNAFANDPGVEIKPTSFCDDGHGRD